MNDCLMLEKKSPLSLNRTSKIGSTGISSNLNYVKMKNKFELLNQINNLLKLHLIQI